MGEEFHFEYKEGVYRIEDVDSKDMAFMGRYSDLSGSMPNSRILRLRLEELSEWARLEDFQGEPLYMDQDRNFLRPDGDDLVLDTGEERFEKELYLMDAEARLRGDDDAWTVEKALNP